MRYTTLADTKTHLGITGSSSDSFLTMEIRHAEAKLDSILSVSRLDIHKVSDERHDATGVKELYLHDIQVVEIGEILDDTNVYTQTPAYDIDFYVLNLDKSLVQGEREAHIDYAAGWNASGIAKLTVSDYTAITATMTLTIAPGAGGATVLTEGTEWSIGATNNATAISIADAINLALNTGVDTATGTRAFALKAVVYIIDETPARITSTITASALEGLSLVSGGGTVGVATTALTMDGVDFPDDLLDAVYLMIGAKFNQRKGQGVKSYKIGSKSVTFTTGELRAEIKTLAKPYMRAAVNVI